MTSIPASAGRRAEKTVFVTESGKEVWGILAKFDTPAAIYHAAEKVRDAGYAKWDTYTPFPVHGMEEAMGVKRTKLPIMSFAGAMIGAGLGYLMQYWMSAVDYQMLHQGKPFGAWEAFVPITFELGILITAFTTLIGMLALNGLPRWHHPLFSRASFLASSDDTFFLAIETRDPKFDPESTRELLRAAGASSVELVEDE
jgi:hypothetical protein